MNDYGKNIQNIKKVSEDTFVLNYKGRSFYLTLSKQEDTIQPKLYEELKIRNLTLADAKAHKVFKDCNSIHDIEEKFKHCLLHGKADIIEDQNKYHLVLFDDISDLKRDNSKEDQLSSSVKELKDEILKRGAKGELNRNYNDNYKALNLTINKINESIKAIKIYLEEPKQHNNNSRLVIETQNLVFINKIIRNIQNNIEDKLLNKIEGKILFSEGKLQTIKTSVIIGEYKDCITSMISLPNGYIVTAAWDKTIKIWDLNKNILIKTLEGHTFAINCLALLSDGNIASGSRNKSIKIWESKNDYKCINTLIEHTDVVSCLLVLKNGNLVSGSYDNSIRVWDCKSYKCIKTINDHTDYVFSLINLINGFYASGSDDNTFKI
jgi:WD40 repeat protein